MSSPFNHKGVPNFLSPRLKSSAGYLCLPAISDAMLFFLPTFRIASARVVRIEGRLWELWSPNSKTFAYYPGLSNSDLNLEDSLPHNLRRADGHLGRFDPTVSPQHFDSDRPWLGFIRREGNDDHPEHTALLDVWKPVARPNRGFLASDFVQRLKERIAAVVKRVDTWRVLEPIRPDVWRNRPAVPEIDDVESFTVVMTFDEAVDRLAKVQRSIKYLCAWCRLASAVKEESNSLPEVLQVRSVPSANDSLMGIWLNGCEEGDGMQFLRWRVPCYIIHSVDTPSEIERATVSCYPVLPDFISRTPAARLAPEIYAIDIAVLREKGDLRDVVKDFDICPSQSIIPHMRTDRLRSSPLSQGFNDGQYTDPRLAPSLPSSTRIVEEVEGKLIPPPVAGVASGQWSVWHDTFDSEGNECVAKAGRNASRSLGGKIYFDRNNRRRLHFSEHPFVPPNYDADIEIFGLPAPDGRYLELGNNGLEFQCTPTKWVYKKERPDQGTEGLTYSPPSIEIREANTGIERQIEDSSESEEEEPMDLRSRSSGSPIPVDQTIDQEMRPINLSRLPIDEDSIERSTLQPQFTSSEQSASSAPSLASARHERPFPHRSERELHGTWDQIERRPRRRSRSTSARRDSRPQGSFLHSDRHWSPPPGHSSHWSRRASPPYRSRFRSSVDFRTPRRSRSKSPRGRSRPPALRRRFSPPRTPLPHTRSPTPPRMVRRERSRSPSSQRREPLAPSMAVDEEPLDTLPQDDAMLDFGASTLMNIARVPLQDRETLEALLPPMTAPSFPVLTALDARANSKYLSIWSLAVFIPWEDVVVWVQNLSRASKVQVSRIVRINRDGSQVFCFKMGSKRDAAYLRGLVQGAHTNDVDNIQCDFINDTTYNDICGMSVDAWTPLDGFKVEQSSLDPMSLNPRQLPKVTLFDRLSSAINPTPSYTQDPPVSTGASQSSLLARLSSAIANPTTSSYVESTEEKSTKKKRRGTKGRRR